MIKYNILIPIFNEEESILKIYNQIKELDVFISLKVTFIDDGSTDNSLKIIKNISLNNKHVDFIALSKNFGHQIALSAGIDNSNSEATLMMDADMQHPVKYIPEMINKFNQKFDVVQMVKENQGKRNLFIRILSFLFYFLFRKFSDINISNNVSDFRLISKKVCNELKLFNEKERFIRGMVQWVGFNYAEIKYTPDERKYGKSKYNFFKLIKLASYGVFSFSSLPLKISLYFGLALSIFSFSYGVFAICKRFFFKDIVPVGYTDLIFFITFIGGIQLVFLGVLGLYILKIFEQVRGRPLYIIKDIKND